MDDEALVRAFQQRGTPAHFQTLVARHRERVLRLVASVLGPGRLAEAEGVVQEVFVRVHNALPRFRLESRFSSWLYRIAYREAVDRRSLARLRQPHLPIETLERAVDPRRETSPLEELLTSETRREIATAVDGLPDLYRCVVHMRYWLDAPVAEIADALGAPAGTVKSYLFRARKRLRAALGHRGGDRDR